MQPVKKRIASSGTNPRANAMKQPKILMAARVSKKFHERVQAECVQREMSLQKLLVEALEEYINADSEGRPIPLAEIGVLDIDEPEVRALKRLWSTYLHKMPEEKIELMVRAMKWDLQMKKSARRKGPRKRVGREF